MLLATQLPLLAVNDPLEGISGGDKAMLLTLLVFFSFGTLVIVVTVVTRLVNILHKRKLMYDFKRDMLDRGMTIEEIERLIQAGSTPEAQKTPRYGWGHHKQEG